MFSFFMLVLSACQPKPKSEPEYCDNFIKLISAPDSLPVYKFPFHLSDSEKAIDMANNGFNVINECASFVAYPLKSGLNISLHIGHPAHCRAIINYARLSHYLMLISNGGVILNGDYFSDLNKLADSIDHIPVGSSSIKIGYSISVAIDVKPEILEHFLQILVNHSLRMYESLSKQKFNKNLCDLDLALLSSLKNEWKGIFLTELQSKPPPPPPPPIGFEESSEDRSGTKSERED